MSFGTRIVLLLLLVLALFTPDAARAQATRTWVSGVGDDANPCSRTAPCKTFAGAISKTAAGGEISTLDPGGYGAVTITKSITLSGDGSLASVLAYGTNGINVNDGGAGTIRVVIRGLSIHGDMACVNVVSAASVLIDNVSMTQCSDGVRLVPAANSRVDVVVNRSTIGMGTDGIDATGGVVAVIDSVIAGNSGTGVLAKGTSTITVESSQINSNAVALQADGTATVRIANNGFYNNKTAFACGTGTLSSAGNNRKGGNSGGNVEVCAPNAVIAVQ